MTRALRDGGPGEPTVALIGLGRIGTSIANRLLDSHVNLVVCNRTSAKAKSLIERGAKLALSPADAALGASIVISSLLDDKTLEDVVCRTDGLLEGMSTNSIHVSTSTVSPEVTSRVAKLHADRGQGFVAAPLLGRPDVVLNGQAVTLTGGASETKASAAQFIMMYSRKIVDVGHDPRQASALKLTLNFYVVSMIEVFGEALGFAEASGLQRNLAAGLLHELHGNPGITGYLDRISERKFDAAGFELSTGLKDVNLMLAAAVQAEISLPLATIARDHLLMAAANGRHSDDWAALTDYARRADLHST